MNSQFHAAPKALNPVDIKLPENLVKGAVVIDEKLFEWTQKEIPEAICTSTYITINKETDDVDDLIVMLVKSDAKQAETYGLFFEERFLSNESRRLLKQGFILTMTASPAVYARRIHENLLSRGSDSAKIESILQTLSKLAQDKIFVYAFLKSETLGIMYEMLARELDKLSFPTIQLLLQSLYSMMELNVDGLSWETIPEDVLLSLCRLVTGRAKSEDAQSVLFAEWSIEQILNTTNITLHERIFAEVPFISLIRHLDRSDERVSLATLTLMNTIHRKADVQLKNTILDDLGTAPFRNAISHSVLRDGRAKDRTFTAQLIPIQRLLLEKQNILAKLPPSRDDINTLESLDWFTRYASTNLQSTFEAGQHGKLLPIAMRASAQQLALMCRENAMRAEKSRWELMALCEYTMTITSDLLANDENLGRLIEFLFSVENPLLTLFTAIVQLFHKTWREMHAVTSEIVKVSNVVREQVKRVVDKQPASLDKMQAEFDALAYNKMKEIWKQEESDREVAELESELVKDLRELLRPGIEQLVRQNRKNFMKQGYTFKKTGKKATLKEQSQYFFWRLDRNEKILMVIDCDTERFIPGASQAKSIRKIMVKDIKDVQWGDESEKGTRKSSSFSRGIRLLLPGADEKDESLAACAQSDRDMSTWVDGLCELIGKNEMSRDASKLVDRLLSTELRLRLVQVPNPSPRVIAPPLPTTWDWIPAED
ncbi:unnamed protein product, partial [Mesorhabditis belari]|uniref:ELMO domain-containing protein n=1 Tax=Mesorhabditis belari TaxID=2138241 RepID=A0AAF3FEU2_9BILA